MLRFSTNALAEAKIAGGKFTDRRATHKLHAAFNLGPHLQ